MDIFTYSPQSVSLIIGGYQITGWESIGISRNTDGINSIRGIRGKNTRAINKDTSATLYIPILQSEQANEVFTAIHELDLENGTGRISLVLKDNSGNSVFSSDEAYIQGYPEVVYSGELEYRAWKIFCQSTKTFYVGSNANPATSLFSSIYNTIF